MKYIRTKDGRIAEIKENMIIKVCDDATRLVYKKQPYICVLHGDDDIIKQADTIKELCDMFVVIDKEFPMPIEMPLTYKKEFEKMKEAASIGMLMKQDIQLKLAIWTDKGLIYVAKMNEKGELELI